MQSHCLAHSGSRFDLQYDGSVLTQLMPCSGNPDLETQQRIGNSTCWPHVTLLVGWSFTSAWDVELRPVVSWPWLLMGCRAYGLLYKIFKLFLSFQCIIVGTRFHYVTGKKTIYTLILSTWVTDKLTPWLLEPGGSMPHSQELSNNAYRKPNQHNFWHWYLLI